MSISPAGYSKPARAFADKAGALAFDQYRNSGVLAAASAAATEIAFGHSSYDY
jgi:hypothetical protein